MSAEEMNPDVQYEREMARKKRLRRKAEKAIKELEELKQQGMKVPSVTLGVEEIEIRETEEGLEIRPEVVEARLEALGIEQKSQPQVEVQPITISTYDRPVKKKCKAHSARTGEPCRLPPLLGMEVCRTHGGAAPQAKRKARERIEQAADLMARELLKMAQSTSVKDGVKLTAIRDSLDRAGLAAKTAVSVEVETPAYLEVFDSICHTRPTELRPLGAPTQAELEAPTATSIVDATWVELPPERPAEPRNDAPRVIRRARLPQPRNADIVDMGNGLVAFEDAVGQAQRVRPPGPRTRR